MKVSVVSINPEQFPVRRPLASRASHFQPSIAQIVFNRPIRSSNSSEKKSKEFERKRLASQSGEGALKNEMNLKTEENIFNMFNYCARVRRPFREIIDVSRMQQQTESLRNPEEKIKYDSKTLPFIVQKAALKPIQRKIMPAVSKTQPEKAELPKTGQYLPFCMPQQFLPVPNDMYECIDEPVSSAVIKSMQLKESERFSAFSTKSESSYKLVYDIYENSPYQENYGYEDFIKYGISDFQNIEPYPANYAQICSGKGAPTKFIPNKAFYSKELLPYYKLENPDDKTLIFESRFESGNLRRAIQMYFFVSI